MPASGTKLRILQIVKGLDIGRVNGGAERFGADLACGLKSTGCEVRVCAFFRTGSDQEAIYVRKLEQAGVEVFFAAQWAGNNHFGSYMEGISALSGRLGAAPVDVCHSHFQLGTLAALYLKTRRRTHKALRTAHLAYEWEANWYGKLRRSLIAGWIYPLLLDAEVGVSQDIVDRLRASPGAKLARRKPVLIYNAIAIDASPSVQPLADGERRPDAPIIGTVGRISEQKGQRYLLEAAPEVLQRFPQAQFWIIGEGEPRAELEKKAAALGLGQAVKFLGQRSGVCQLVRQMDLFVSPSLWEGLPTVILESMACGVPVIATDIPGTREIIQPQINGLLVPPGDPAALAGAILTGLEQPDLMRQLAQQALEMLDRFTIPRVAAAYLELYQRLMSA
jgi:glycosyltransferase involved in cell wall biosynthesis